MNVISSAHGFVIKFDNKESMKCHIENLKGQLEWIEKENINPPYLYSLYYNETTKEDIQNLLDKIKEKEYE